MKIDAQKILKTLSPKNVIIPILIGLGVSIYLFWDSYKNIQWSELLSANIYWLLTAVAVILIRNFGYVYRIRIITEKELSWKSSFNVIMLWEFCSAVTPSAVGGTPIAIFLLLKEKISLARSLAFVTVTAVFDNLFLIVASGSMLLYNSNQIFPDASLMDFKLNTSMQYFFGLSFSLIFIYTFIMVYGLFINPNGLKWLLNLIFSVKFLKKWQTPVSEFADDIINASIELKNKSWTYWISIGVITFLVWGARFYLVNCLTAAYNPFFEHLLMFARHCVLWVVILVAPTPGGAGLAEISFNTFFGEYLGNYITPVLIFWRFVTYWLYLFIGIIILPLWLKKNVFDKN